MSRAIPNAAGFSLKIANIDKLLKYSNQELANINFNENSYDVDFVVKGNCSYLLDLIYDLNKGEKLWGQGNSEPKIAVEDISIDKNEIAIIGQKKNVIRFEFNGITYIKFFAENQIEELSIIGNKIKINLVGKSNINYYNGSETPQILIDGIEIKEISNIDF